MFFKVENNVRSSQSTLRHKIDFWNINDLLNVSRRITKEGGAVFLQGISYYQTCRLQIFPCFRQKNNVVCILQYMVYNVIWVSRPISNLIFPTYSTYNICKTAFLGNDRWINLIGIKLSIDTIFFILNIPGLVVFMFFIIEISGHNDVPLYNNINMIISTTIFSSITPLNSSSHLKWN